MGARAITILIGSVLGAKHNVLARNSAICWKTPKRLVLLNSENLNDIKRVISRKDGIYSESSESIRRTSLLKKMCSALMRKYERLAEMTNPNFFKLATNGLRTTWFNEEFWLRNSAICGNTSKRFVLIRSKNQNDVTTGNPQGRFVLRKPSENIRRTPLLVKICSELIGNYERQAEMTCPS